MGAKAGQAEYTVPTDVEALLARLRDKFLLDAWEHGDFDGDHDRAVACFECSRVAEAVQTICADEQLRAFALDERTEIHVQGSRRPLFTFENGGGSAIDDDWYVNTDFPLGTAMVIHDDLVASATPCANKYGLEAAYRGQAEHRRREQALFTAEAEKRCGPDHPECELASALDELAEACGQDADIAESSAQEWKQWRRDQSVVEVLHARRVTRSRTKPRRLDRRLACGRPRTRAAVRASSRGGDSGDSSDSGEPGPGPGSGRLDGHRPPSREGAAA